MTALVDSFQVFRYGDTKPSGWAVELPDAIDMLKRGVIEGEVRDPTGKVVYRYAPKKPLAQRIEDAEKRVRSTTRALAEAQRNARGAAFELERLKRLEADRTAEPTTAASPAVQPGLFEEEAE